MEYELKLLELEKMIKDLDDKVLELKEKRKILVASQTKLSNAIKNIDKIYDTIEEVTKEEECSSCSGCSGHDGLDDCNDECWKWHDDYEA